MRSACLSLLCLLSLFVISSQAEPVLVKVLYGDTVIIRDLGQTYHLRLLDIDAPELQQAYGKQAKRELMMLCDTSPGTAITVEPQGQDPYGRTLGRLFCNHTDASEHQIAVGMAWFSSRYSKRIDLEQLQLKARQQGLGLWQQANAMPPWMWRKRYGRHYRQQE